MPILCAFFLILSPTNLRARQPALEFSAISVEEGLSQSMVQAILQDSRGLMWFGTGDGLNRYDGYQIKIYKYDREDPETLSHSAVSQIYEDLSGDLWIGSDGGGLSALARGGDTFSRYRHDSGNPHSLSNNHVTAIYQESPKAIWIGTGGGGLDRLDKKEQRFSHYRNDPGNQDSLSNNHVTALYGDGPGVLDRDQGRPRPTRSEAGHLHPLPE